MLAVAQVVTAAIVLRVRSARGPTAVLRLMKVLLLMVLLLMVVLVMLLVMVVLLLLLAPLHRYR